MARLFKHYVPKAVLLLGLFDFVLLAGAGEAAWHLRAWQIGTDTGPLGNRIWPLAGFAIVIWLAMVAVGVYAAEALRSMRYAAARLLVAISLSVIVLSVVDFVSPGATFWRSTLLYAVIIALLALLAGRAVLPALVGARAFRRRIVVLGSGARADRIVELSDRAESGFEVVARVALGGRATAGSRFVTADLPDLRRVVTDLRAGEVVLALEERRNALPLKDLLRARTTGVHVYEYSSFLERETGRLDLETTNPSWLIFSDGFSSGRAVSSVAKRVFDIVASGLVLAITAPLIALFALLVKLDSDGPAFFRQKRVGLYGQTFEIIKLRSMRTDAEKDGAKWAERNDPRVTRLGRFIRKVRIDELPQTWSVLRGEMSFVGPRPEVPAFVADLEERLPYYAERHMVKPGITGWAQINYPYGASLEDARRKLEYDLYYAKNYSPFLDLLILLQTLRVILWPDGAR